MEKGFKRPNGDAIKMYALAIILLLAMACSHTPTTREIAFKTLSAAATSYEQTMTALGDYYKQGKITEETKDKIVEAGEVYWGAYHSAVIALEVYERSSQLGDGVDKAKLRADLDTALMELNTSLLDFLHITTGYLERLEKINN